MKTENIWRKRVGVIVVLSMLYITLGYSVTTYPNPFFNNLPIAFYMVVVVFAGIIYGKYTGLSVGIFGALLAIIYAFYFRPDSSNYLFAIGNIIPHAIMGYLAGLIAKKTHNFFLASLSIIVGHFLNFVFFSFFGLFGIDTINSTFWYFISYETLIDIIVIYLSCKIFLISFPYIKNQW